MPEDAESESDTHRNGTREVLVPVEEATGECYHHPTGCGGHLVTKIEATAAELIRDRGLKPCGAAGCSAAGLDKPVRCDGCGLPVFEPEVINDADYCDACAVELHKHPSKQDHEQYRLRGVQS